MYSDFAYVYDLLTKDVDYSKMADYIESLFSEYMAEKPKLLLDLACGTGSLTLELAKRGYDMIGIDASEDMLNCAVEKSGEAQVFPLWVCQDMRNFELYGTVDAILCTLDSLNYITDYGELKLVFSLVRNYLNPGGLFIFDMNTPYKLESILGNNFFYEIGEDIAYIWQNTYDRDTRICSFDLTLFVKESGDLYKRFEEEQQQKAWNFEEVKSALQEAGLKLMGIFDEYTKNPPRENSERCFFVATR
ncbi:methyltransferase type 11 [Thermoclostridium stercorarium subsp. stercorarium DSM 8532]|jgi:SAM-dependent methyltransferase|uniref:Methyltransferase type 11 n=3 Tax=Thermoclostridium stercorarium TaxID=1510 RepID=L7VL50_THES1|nr:class I SAM-dependent methyltransferase [Thermoclostridium stercorarium]AGC67389.1 methyltransferase type 11 [Thermoclostridium stercorarium subsp. stercorarium DSM 8532]AGI38449.1 methyltransferase domain-containing protein [Thermoclostridium stercorarium subsp. stercorarium DSM 8532]ANW97880.1 methyltransferase type 11 [Thermoclostridium stercorarium subsp. thermolacticum DSM 2910]ANX00432.1 methyltransferase type 11 [Thermoclostridium stercorarium subsp. leptospartum DSM 9219]UZQ85978.1 